MKIYLEVYYLGCDNAAELQYNFSQSFTWCNNSMSFALKLRIPPSGDDNTDSATRSQRVQSLVTHGIIDKATYLSKATK